jgi:arginase
VLAASPILDIPGAALSDRGVADVAAAALKRLTLSGSREELHGFWIHVDADVINPTVMAAVDSPEPGGPTIKELVDPLTPLVSHPRALGWNSLSMIPDLTPTDHAPLGLRRCWRMFSSEFPLWTGGLHDRSNMARDGSSFEGR